MPAKKKSAPKKKTGTTKKTESRLQNKTTRRSSKKIARASIKKKTSKTTPSASKKKIVKPRAPKAPILPWRKPLPGETPIGIVDDYFAHINVIAMTLTGRLSVGDKLHVRGHTTDMTEAVESMQINHRAVSQAGVRDAVGIKVAGRCRKGDYVYRVAT